MSSMRGLVQFIADLRNARARDLEEKRINKELANIRQKFRDGGLNGYQRKKYVCKLLYVYIQGYDVDFGHLEAVNLVSAKNYSEKQIGYLAVTLFLHEQHELLHLVVNSIRKDLLDMHELNNCLALHAIATVGGREMGEALSSEVHRLLISPTSKSFVKKKAALTLLRLYRKHPSIVQQEWAERIISIMDDPDMGVTLSVTSLVMALVQENPEEYKGSYVKAAQRLKKIAVDGDVSPDYLYYRVPNPWLQVKLLRLLQYYPPSEDTHVRELIRQSLEQIMNSAFVDTPRNVQQNNAQNAILFEAINLLIHLDTEHALMMQMSSRLGKFIQSRETNVRYLGLEAMTHFAARAETLDPIKSHQPYILGSLRDRDISIRRKGLDLLYSMCDVSNARTIVAELLTYLQSADYAIREEMVLKVAILAEKYATDAQWYIDTSLKLLAMAGDHVSDEVWQRVIQIVTNNEELQAYAADHLLKSLKGDCHDSLIKIGSYVLGEFGHLIADQKGSSPIEQFLALQPKMFTCSDNTRAMILSSFIKFVNLFPEIKPQLLQMFRLYSHSPDPELQQRAFEYLKLATMPTDELLRTVCDEMPPFSERASVLLSRLHQKTAGTSDKRTWVVGGKDANTDKQEVLMAQTTGLKRTFTTIVNGGRDGATNGSASKSLASRDLEGLDMSPKPSAAPNFASAAHLSPDWEYGFNRLYFADEGVLFEDAQIQVGLRSEYRAHLGVVKIYFTNKASFPIGSFTTTLDNPSAPNLKIDTKNLPESSVQPAAQTQQTLFFESHGPFSDAPTIRISYLAGALQAYTLQLPILMHRYMEPSDLSAEDFFKRWRQIGGHPLESQKTFAVTNKGRTIHEKFTRSVVTGFGWKILSDVDPNSTNIVGCAVYQVENGKTGCLLRLEPNYEKNMYRITIRATQENVPAILARQMEQRLSLGVSIDTDLTRG